MQGTPATVAVIPLGTWWGKPRKLEIHLPGRRGLTCSEIQQWRAYETVEPFGEFRSELRHGQLMALTANLKRNSETKPEPFTSLDFMNFTEQPKEKKLTPAQINNAFKQLFGAK